MTAREEIFKRLAGAFISDDRANALIDAFAHELAERQRAHLRNHGYEPDCICGLCSACLATEFIDLVDPKKGSNG